MNIKNTFLITLGLTATFSCTTSLKTSNRTNKTAEVKLQPIISFPVVMDLEIDLSKKVKGTASGITSMGITAEYYKEMATSQAMIASDADVLIEPVYQVTITKISGKSAMAVEVVVTGYAAKYKNAKNISAADTTMIKFALKNLQGVPVLSTPSNPTRPTLANPRVRPVKTTRVY